MTQAPVDAETLPSAPTLNWEQICSVLKRRRRLLLATVFGIWLMVFVVAWILPPKYESDAVIVYDQELVPKEYVRPNIQISLSERIQTMSQEILSRTRLAGIIDTYKLYSSGRSRRVAPSELVDRMRNDIDIVSMDLTTAAIDKSGKPVPTTKQKEPLSAFQISYQASSPRVAQQVTNALTSLFIDENLRQTQEQSRNTTNFLDSQLAELKKTVDAQDEAIREFKSRYTGELPSQLQTNNTILAGLQSRLTQANEAVNRSEQQRLYLQALLQQYLVGEQNLSNPMGVSAESLLTNAQTNIQKMRDTLAGLQAKYTDRHPAVRHLKEEIAKAEVQYGQLRARLSSDNTEKRSANGPLTAAERSLMAPRMHVESELKSNERELADHRKEVQEFERKVQEYQARLSASPIREQQLDALMRDYKQTKADYDSLLGKRNESALATNLQARLQGEQFRLLDAASLPDSPSFPNRPQFAWIGLGLGLFVAIGLVVVLELMDSRVRYEGELKTLTRAPLLAAVPLIRTADEQRKYRRLRWVEWTIAALLLIVIGVGNCATYIY